MAKKSTGTDAELAELNLAVKPYVVTRSDGPLGAMFSIKGPALETSCGGGRDNGWTWVRTRAWEAAAIYRMGYKAGCDAAAALR